MMATTPQAAQPSKKTTLAVGALGAAIGLCAGIAWAIPTATLAASNGADDTVVLAWPVGISASIIVTAALSVACFRRGWVRHGPGIPALIGFGLALVPAALLRVDVIAAAPFGALIGIASHYVFALVTKRFRSEVRSPEHAHVRRRDVRHASAAVLLSFVVVIVISAISTARDNRFEERALETIAVAGLPGQQQTISIESRYQNGLGGDCNNLRHLRSESDIADDQRDAAEATAQRYEAAGFAVERYELPATAAVDPLRVVRAIDGDFGADVWFSIRGTRVSVRQGCETLFRDANARLNADRLVNAFS